MRRYLIDSGPLAALLYDRPAALQLMTPWMLRHEAATSILTYAEVLEYITPRANFPAHHQGLQHLLLEIYPYFLTYRILERYTQIRLQLRRPYGEGLIGDIDTLIAATALERNLIIVTMDGDFLRVPELGVMLLDRDTLAVLQQREPTR
jgi:predicted nucleic acid-binding protein